MGRKAKPWRRGVDDQWYTKHDGKHVPLRVYGQRNEAEAWAAFHVFKTTGTVPTPTNVPPPVKVVTLRDLTEAFTADAVRRDLATGTLGTYRSFLTPFVTKWGDTAATDLTPTTLDDYAAAMTRWGRPWSPDTKRAFKALLISVYKYAVRIRLVERSPFIGMKLPGNRSRGVETVFTDEEFDRLIGTAHPRFAEVLRFCRLTGCRPGEAVQLTAKDVVWEASVAVVREHKTMNKGKKRNLPLHPDALSLLRELAKRHPTGLLFRNRAGTGWDSRAWVGAMRRCRERVGLKGKIVYSCRHTFATQALIDGIPDAKVAAILGHSSTVMLHHHYNHLTESSRDLVDAVTTMWNKKSPDQKAEAKHPSGFVSLTPDQGPG